MICFGSPAALTAKPLEGLTFSTTKDPNHFKFVYQPDPEKDPVTGVLGLPKGIGPFRTVIVNHGPDGDALKVAYNYMPQFLDRGYAGLTVDVKYAAKPEESDWSEIVRRLNAVVEIAQNDERLDAKKIFMFGNGWGAMITVAFAAQTDKLKAVAVTGSGRLPKDGVKYEKINAPLMLVHGKKDESVPLDAAMQLKSNLERAGKTVEMKVFDENGHEVVTMKAQDVYDAVVAFFNKQAVK